MCTDYKNPFTVNSFVRLKNAEDTHIKFYSTKNLLEKHDEKSKQHDEKINKKR